MHSRDWSDQPIRPEDLRPALNETAARAAGWVPLAEVLAALDEYDHDWDSAGARDMHDFLTERFAADQTKEGTSG